ncbi:SANT and BTB domain regulator of class switch recombination-like [Bolinopsis microptera]|uniref:SANT and BTB domain regulator of class switch recombination-like n=1 Tax=Bolinopsis microptera TaxID=2820187 RepID=UPI00307A0EFD
MSDEANLSKKSSGTSNNTKPAKEGKRSKKTRSSAQNTIVIHVCDESKKINQDFHCSRDLLVEEMKYFAEYLATDVKHCEEVDISVHCDVQIFDWLMRYVQRDKSVPLTQCQNMPKLEPNNVISILISSDFLKMDALVRICIEYCHKHISEIISAPCNMNCISGQILTEIAQLFSLQQIEVIRDRKDKFKSKLFAKKVESLLEGSSETSDIFRCTNCKRILSGQLQGKVPCTTGRMTVGYNGVLNYSHSKDLLFNMSDHLVTMRTASKTWRDIYWSLWATLNYMTCEKCHHTFPLNENYECLYHPERAVFKDGEDQISAAVGVYPCCRQRALRFDPLTCPQGCEKMKHTIPQIVADLDKSKFSAYPADLIQMFEDHEDIIINSNEGDRSFPTSEYNMFLYEELACGVAVTKTLPVEKLEKQPSLGSLNNQTDQDSESVEGVEEDETEDEEVTQIIKKRQQTANKRRNKANRMLRNSAKQEERPPERCEIYVESVSSDGSKVMGGGDYASSKIRWDSRRSRRWNQDAQRDDDKLRTGELVSQLNSLKLQMKRTDITKSKETHPGGLYYLLENKFKAQRSNNKDSGHNRVPKRRTILSIP